MDLIAGALSSSFLLIFLVIFPPVLMPVWLIHHPCRDIVANRAAGSFCIVAYTLRQLEIYDLPLILSSQARLVQAFDSLTVHLDSVIVFKSFLPPLAESSSKQCRRELFSMSPGTGSSTMDRSWDGPEGMVQGKMALVVVPPSSTGTSTLCGGLPVSWPVSH